MEVRVEGEQIYLPAFAGDDIELLLRVIRNSDALVGTATIEAR